YKTNLDLDSPLNPSQNHLVLEIILQKQRSRNYHGITYYKYRITIPTQIVAQLNLEGKEKLDVSVIKNTIVIRRTSRS
ncbi:MAG: AbrB/MazE/SpoVT family DNA-binding domain-containing protein, partial [Nitrosotalea sp.]